MYCERIKQFLMKLEEEGKFYASPRPLTTDDLFTKYLVGDNFRLHWDDLRLCPKCDDKIFKWNGNCVGVKYDSFDPQRHYHICTVCGWQSKIMNGNEFEVLEEENAISE